MTSASDAPRIGLVIGDPCGISPELTARLLADREIVDAAAVLVIGDSRVLAAGAKTAGVELDPPTVERAADADIAPGRPALLDLRNLDPASVSVGDASAAGGAYALENFKIGLGLARDGVVD